MTTAADIIVSCRDSLSDPSGARWADARLIRLINEAQKDIVNRTLILRSTYSISAVSGTSEYTLPTDLIALSRVVKGATKIEFRTHSQMDNLLPEWEATAGDEVKFAVYDKLSPKKIRLYPTPNNSDRKSVV